MATYIWNSCSASHMTIFECGFREVQKINVANISSFFCFQFIAILMLMMGFFIVFWSVQLPYKKMTERFLRF